MARRFLLAGQIGLGSPGGLIGVEGEYALQRWLVLGAGLGPTLTDSLVDTGWQAGAWLAPRWALTSVAAGVDLGVSAGPYHARGLFNDHGRWAEYDMAQWFNAAARFQYQHRRGLSFRAFLGVARLLNPADGRCGDGWSSMPCRTPTLGYGGLAFGYAFES